MPGLPGFSDNPFRDRDDLLRAATAIIKPLEQYRSKSKARVKLYPSTAAGFDEKRVTKYRQQAMEFAPEYWRYFDTNGAAIPFGRSMTYRFACGAFWSAFALSDIQSPQPQLSLGTIKGLLLRHLRWWAKQPEIFNSDGTMNIGYAYPNMYMSEDYNSRQSVYWCLKSFVVLGLPSDHPFWTVQEEPHPIYGLIPSAGPPDTARAFPAPHQIVCHSEEHHYLLSAGQMTTKMFKARDAKYGKFAYSSAFGYSVPTGLELHQIAPDSTLTVKLDDDGPWRVRSQPADVRFDTIPIHSAKGYGHLPSITSTWRPVRSLDITIQTTLIPLTYHYPGWHLRIHHVRGFGLVNGIAWFNNFEMVDSSFAVDGLTDPGYHISAIDTIKIKHDGQFAEGYVTEQSSVLVKSRGGVSGIADLTPNIHLKGGLHRDEAKLGCRGYLIQADPNTNLVARRTLIPSIRYSGAGAMGDQSNVASEGPLSAFVATAVFGVSNMNQSMEYVPNDWYYLQDDWGLINMLEIDVTAAGETQISIQQATPPGTLGRGPL
ncbi:hypothetical protein H9Q74_010861 [Fusarium xylarioides]|nr:hypothetical protein H9Q74_010861 [Fusarium xylarioides]KAG5818313.1 hypothetical protein H9Q71_001485 [Fusarium xylarioides]